VCVCVCVCVCVSVGGLDSPQPPQPAAARHPIHRPQKGAAAERGRPAGQSGARRLPHPTRRPLKALAIRASGTGGERHRSSQPPSTKVRVHIPPLDVLPATRNTESSAQRQMRCCDVERLIS
jgi:hypothetical protein